MIHHTGTFGDLRTAPAAEISPYGVEMMEDTAIRGH